MPLRTAPRRLSRAPPESRWPVRASDSRNSQRWPWAGRSSAALAAVRRPRTPEPALVIRQRADGAARAGVARRSCCKLRARLRQTGRGTPETSQCFAWSVLRRAHPVHEGSGACTPSAQVRRGFGLFRRASQGWCGARRLLNDGLRRRRSGAARAASAIAVDVAPPENAAAWRSTRRAWRESVPGSE
jgi:hypothetical protein